MNYYSFGSIVLVIGLFLAIEFSFLMKRNNSQYEALVKKKISFTRMDYFLFIYAIIASTFLVITYIIDTPILLTAFWLCVIIVVYAFISEFYFNRSIKIRLAPNGQSISIIVGCLIVLIIFASYSTIARGTLISASLLSDAGWFSDTFLQMLASEQTQATIGLMTIGAITIIIGKTRRSGSISVGGFFLVVGLPIFSIFDTLVSDPDEIQQQASEIFFVFRSAGLTVLIYVIIMTMFYALLSSIVITFLSMIDLVYSDDD